MVALAEDFDQDMACLLLPVGTISLLLPSVCIAEVLPWRRVRPIPETPAWMLGMFSWRGESIPVVRYEPLNGATENYPTEGRCVVVLNRCRSAGGRAFYAVATDALPRMVQLGAEDCVPEQIHLGVAESAALRLGTEQARIPNLGFFEDQLALAESESAAS